MNDYKKLTSKEKDEVFENVWSDYSSNKLINNLYFYIALAAMVLVSIVVISQYDYNFSKEKTSNYTYSELIDYDLYEDNELSFNESLGNMNQSDLDNILTQL